MWDIKKYERLENVEDWKTWKIENSGRSDIVWKTGR